MRKSLPSSVEYLAAVQQPSALRDAELRARAVERSANGLPRPRSGGFATVFRFQGAKGLPDRAVKCFIRETPEFLERYGAIGDFIKRSRCPYFVGVRPVQEGIRVRGAWHPVLVMEWVEGAPLSSWTGAHLQRPDALRSAADNMLRLGRDLGNAGCAHGDLQHGNILVLPGGHFRLVDYDGMYLPELAERHPGQHGLPSYQHPERTRTHAYDRFIDRFPLLVLYLSLRALSEAPDPQSLWTRHGGDDGMMFTEDDLTHPKGSRLLRDLQAVLGQETIGDFREVCAGPYSAVPDLATFLRSTREASVVDGRDLDLLTRRVGRHVNLVAPIASSFERRNRAGLSYVFLNARPYPGPGLTLVLWPDQLQACRGAGMEPLSLKGHWVRASGELACYSGRLQLTLAGPHAIAPISAAEAVGLLAAHDAASGHGLPRDDVMPAASKCTLEHLYGGRRGAQRRASSFAP